MSQRPIRPPTTIQPGGIGHNLLRRVLRVEAGQISISRMTLIDDPHWRIGLQDTGPNGTPVAVTDRETSIHVLWARDDDTAALHIASREIAIAPGDTITLPAGIAWGAAPGMILCNISGPGHDSREASSGPNMIAPTHGRETFHGYNRQTTYPSPSGLSIERWKITQPLVLPGATSPYAIIDLTEPLALMWPGGTDLIGRGQCRIIPPGIGPITLLPDGLGYALIVSCLSRPWTLEGKT